MKRLSLFLLYFLVSNLWKSTKDLTRLPAKISVKMPPLEILTKQKTRLLRKAI